MAALAYVLLPISGLIAFSMGRSPRVRFHGAQAILIGLLWPVFLYCGSFLSPRVTQIFFLAGALMWASFLVATALGRDPLVPLAGDYLARELGLDGRPSAVRNTGDRTSP